MEINGEERVYELLCILDFNNVRKRMSVSSIYTYIILCIICIEIHNLYVTLYYLKKNNYKKKVEPVCWIISDVSDKSFI